jgi:hypothetical protein
MSTDFITFPSLSFVFPPHTLRFSVLPNPYPPFPHLFTLNKITLYHFYPQIIQFLAGSPSLSLLYIFLPCLYYCSINLHSPNAFSLHPFHFKNFADIISSSHLPSSYLYLLSLFLPYSLPIRSIPFTSILPLLKVIKI